MNTIKYLSLALVIGLVLPLVLRAQPVKPHWVLYAQTKTGLYYYDSLSVKKMRDGNFSVWTKSQNTPDSLASIRKALIETREKLHLYEGSENPEPNTLNRYARGYYETWLYTVCSTVIDCRKGRYLNPTVFDYDENDKILGHVEDPNPSRHWLDIDPNTTYKPLMDVICR